MLSLILMAYDVKPFQVSSRMPLDQQEFDLVANVPAGATKEQFRVMLQNFLAERFALKVHMESKEFPAYELVVGKSGFKLKEAVPGETASRTDTPASRPEGNIGWPEFPANVARIAAQYSRSGGYGLVRLKAQLEPFSALAGMLEDDTPIVDRTGLTGKYSFTLEHRRLRLPLLPTCLRSCSRNSGCNWCRRSCLSTLWSSSRSIGSLPGIDGNHLPPIYPTLK